MAFKFTSAECNSAASSLTTSAGKIGDLVEEFTNIINSVKGNYQSDASTEISNSFENVKGKVPEFQTAIEECAKYLTDTVAPAYEKLEQTAKDKIVSA